MKKKIEIYVRNSGNKNLLMLHIPEGTKERLIEGISNGSFEARDLIIYLELTVLDEWRNSNNPDHLKLEINEITVDHEN